MKKIILLGLALVLVVSLTGCASVQGSWQQQTGEADMEAVKSTVLGFGKKLQEVSLMAPEDILEESMKESYGGFVVQELIDKWIQDPQNAPGRLTSSPWPDRIEIMDIKKASEDTYEVKGEIIEITSAEQASGEAAAKRPVILTVKKADDKWLINKVMLGDYE